MGQETSKLIVSQNGSLERSEELVEIYIISLNLLMWMLVCLTGNMKDSCWSKYISYIFNLT